MNTTSRYVIKVFWNGRVRPVRADTIPGYDVEQLDGSEFVSLPENLTIPQAADAINHHLRSAGLLPVSTIDVLADLAPRVGSYAEADRGPSWHPIG